MKAGQVLPVPGELVFELLLGQLQATKKIKQEMPKTSVMMVTMHENSDYLFEAVKAGAAGYVLKDASGERLLGAVRRTLEGESPLNQELAMQLLVRLSRESGSSEQGSRALSSETAQEESRKVQSEGGQPPAFRPEGTRAGAHQTGISRTGQTRRDEQIE